MRVARKDLQCMHCQTLAANTSRTVWVCTFCDGYVKPSTSRDFYDVFGAKPVDDAIQAAYRLDGADAARALREADRG